MNAPLIPPEHGEGTGPDALERSYRRASAHEASRPGPQVREAILAQARSSVAAPEHPGLLKRSAANDARWRWQAAAGIATIGLVGLLSWHFARVAPPSLVASQAVAPQSPIADATAKQANEAAARPLPPRVPRSPAPAVAPVPAIAAAAAPVRLAAQSSLRNSRAASLGADVAASAADPGWHDRVLRAARMLYPELFSATPQSAAHGPLTVTIALNADGSVNASSRQIPAAIAPAPGEAAALIRESLGIAPDELADSGVIAAEDGVLIVYGIRRPQATDGSGTR
jgi:hypothetical protein